jgi:hypothetical protein
MTAAAEPSALEARVGHYYQMDGTYLGRPGEATRVRPGGAGLSPAHWDPAAAAELGYSGLATPLTFTSTPGMTCNRRMFEQVVVGYDTYMQTEANNSVALSDPTVNKQAKSAGRCRRCQTILAA